MIEEERKEKPSRLGRGPFRYGDPDDLSLRKTERDIIIPKMIREEASKKCPETLKVFLDCSKKAGLLVTFKCQDENKANNECILSWIKNPEFVTEVTDKYLKGRSHFRRSGQPLEKYQRKKETSSMC